MKKLRSWMKLDDMDEKSEEKSNLPQEYDKQAGTMHSKPTQIILNLPAKEPTASISNINNDWSVHVLPGYHYRFTQRNFYNCFDFDEIEDEIDCGEFSVVYKCRRVEFEEDSDEYSIENTIHSISRTFTPSQSGTSVFDSDESDSDSESVSEEEIFAVKRIKKAKFHHLNHDDKQKYIKLLQQKIKFLENIQHLKQKNIKNSKYFIDLIDVFEDENYLYIVTSYCSGGNLWSHIERAGDIKNSDDIEYDETDKIDSEKAIQRIMKQILEGLTFLHQHNVAHLYISPDHIMFTEDNDIQLIGLSHMKPSLHEAGDLVGYPNFVAPEVIEGFYDKKADIWSVGVIFFMLRLGYPPFFEDATITEIDEDNKGLSPHKNLFEKIKKGFDPKVKDGLGPWFPAGIPISDSLKDLISRMLEINVSKRLTATECLAHPYFQTTSDSNKLSPIINYNKNAPSISIINCDKEQLIHIITDICNKSNENIEEHTATFISWVEQNDIDGATFSKIIRKRFAEAIIAHSNGNEKLRGPSMKLFKSLNEYDINQIKIN